MKNAQTVIPNHENCVVPDEEMGVMEVSPQTPTFREREFFIDNLLVRIYFIIEIIWWTGLAPWEFEFPFPGSLTSTFLAQPLNSGP